MAIARPRTISLQANPDSIDGLGYSTTNNEITSTCCTRSIDILGNHLPLG